MMIGHFAALAALMLVTAQAEAEQVGARARRL